MVEKNQGFHKIPGSERRRHTNDEVIGPADENKVIQFQIYLKDKFREEKNRLLEKMADLLPAEREYMSPEEFASKYGANEEDIEKVKDFAKEYGLKVEEVDLAAGKITISGTIGSVNQAFKITLQDHKDPSGHHIGREGSVSIPSSLSDIVQGVYGLSRRKVIKPVLRLDGSLQQHGDDMEEVGRSKSYLPTELAKLYNFPDDLNGEGQCIAILEFGPGGFRQSDLEAYFSKLGIPLPNISAVGINEPQGLNDKGEPGGIDMEVLLDIEVAAAIAPKAKIVVYFFKEFEGELLNAITTAVHDTINRPSVISISYGLWEEEHNWTQFLRDKVNDACMNAGIHGITICISSGDDGSSCIRPGDWNNYEIDDDGVHVSFPGSIPYALSCGGTRLETSDTEIINETVWNENWWDENTQSGGGGATGGGISSYFDVPPYQKGLNLPNSLNRDGRKGRGIPDVAGYAAAIPGIDIIVDGKEFAKGVHDDNVPGGIRISGVGGTSAAAPLWAGLIALFNQDLVKPVGFINNILYKKAAPAGAFRDITVGNNGVTYKVMDEGPVKIKGYVAQSGWDACTGLGSPDGKKLLGILKGQ